GIERVNLRRRPAARAKGEEERGYEALGGDKALLAKLTEAWEGRNAEKLRLIEAADGRLEQAREPGDRQKIQQELNDLHDRLEPQPTMRDVTKLGLKKKIG